MTVTTVADLGVRHLGREVRAHGWQGTLISLASATGTLVELRIDEQYVWVYPTQTCEVIS